MLFNVTDFDGYETMAIKISRLNLKTVSVTTEVKCSSAVDRTTLMKVLFL